MSRSPAPPAPPSRSHVPVRTIATTIAMVLATVLILLVLREVSRVVEWMIVAALLAVVLSPAVGWVELRWAGGRRAVATLIVFLVMAISVVGLVAAFTVPMAREATALAAQLPQQLDDAQAGRGPLGDLLERTHALTYIRDNQDHLESLASGLTTSAAGLAQGLATGIAGVLTVFVLAYLMVLEGPKVVEGALKLLDPAVGARVRSVGADCARSVTGYLTGNLLISLICGVATYIVLVVAGVPFAGLIALFVAIADLIPLVGATLGAIVSLIAAAFHSVPALIAVAIFTVVYQQVENHLLQPLILSRTVKLNPLTVLLSILIAVELAGLLGALVAIPVAGMVQVIGRDLWEHRRGGAREEPAVATDRTPVREEAPVQAHEGSVPTLLWFRGGTRQPQE